MYRVTTRFSGPLVLGGGINQLYFSESAGTAAAAQTAVRDFWDDLSTMMHNTLSLTVDGEVELVDSSTGQITGIETTDPYTRSGTVSSDPLPPHVQGLIRWRTGFFVDGREIRGRTFLPGMTEANSDGGAPGGPTVTLMTTSGNTLAGASGADLVVWSRKGAEADVVSASGWNKWASLRSRRD